MCRLLGYVAARPTSVLDVLGEDGLDRFTALTAVHGDGWGMAWRAEDETIQTVSVADSASADASYRSLSRTPLGRAGIVHLRWASEGLAVVPENTHPFVETDPLLGTVAFAHNGQIDPIDRLESLLGGDSRARLRGTTDSERYFRLLLECVAKEQDLEAGVNRALGVLVEQFPTSSLNALMLTPRAMVAVHVNSAAASPQRRLRALFDSEEDIPARHTTEYFAMDYREQADAVHVISSGLDETGWTPVPVDSASIIDLETRRITTLPVPS
ncbi:putative glutamine amidotransferase [Marmoricola sp. URHA0025 HA25]